MTTNKITIPYGVAADVLTLARAASQYEGLRHQANDIMRIVGEAISIETDFAPGDDHETLLYELLEAVALQSGRRFAQTADRAGVAAAKLTLADMSPALGATQEQAAIAVIREALRAPRLTYVLEAEDGRRLEGGGDCHALPRVGELIALGAGRVRVRRVTHVPGVPVATLVVAPMTDECEGF